MKAFLLAMAMVAPWAALAADAPSDSARAAGPRDVRPQSPVEGLHYSLDNRFLRDRINAPAQGYLAVSLDMGSMQWYRAPTRFEAVMSGAGAAASLGMFVGAIGTTLGWFDEDTSWALTGALAAAGAFYGNARYDLEPRLGLSTQP